MGLLLIGWIALALASVRAWGDGLRSSEPVPLQAALRRLEAVDDGGRDAPLLAFVFSFRDCSAALRAGRLWSTLHRSGRIRVLGVMLDGPPEVEERARFLAGEGIRFPVTAGPADRLVAALVGLGYDTTPITILADARHRPRLIGPATLDSVRQTAFLEVVRAHLDRLSGP